MSWTDCSSDGSAIHVTDRGCAAPDSTSPVNRPSTDTARGVWSSRNTPFASRAGQSANGHSHTRDIGSTGSGNHGRKVRIIPCRSSPGARSSAPSTSIPIGYTPAAGSGTSSKPMRTENVVCARGASWSVTSVALASITTSVGSGKGTARSASAVVSGAAGSSGSSGAWRTSVIWERDVSGRAPIRTRTRTSVMTSPVLLTMRPSTRRSSPTFGTTGLKRSITTPIGASVTACAVGAGATTRTVAQIRNATNTARIARGDRRVTADTGT